MTIIQWLATVFLWMQTGEAQKLESPLRPLRPFGYKAEDLPVAKQMPALVAKNVAIPQQYYSKLNDLAVELWHLKDIMNEDTSIPAEDVSFVRHAIAALATRNGTSVKYVNRHISKYLKIAQQVDELEYHPDASIRLVKAVEALTGKHGVDLTQLEKEKYRKSKPKLYQQFLEAKRDVSTNVSNLLRVQARSKGGMLRYSAFLKALQVRHMLSTYPPAKNWDGYIDEDGVLYTEGKMPIKGKPSFPIVGNPDYDEASNDTFVFHVVTSMGNKQYFCTESSLKGWREERFEKVDEFTPKIDKVRKNWLKDLKSKDVKTSYLSLICELIYWCSARIGGIENNVRGQKTFGISTLQGQHVKKVGNKLVIEYKGKTGVQQKHILQPVSETEKYVASTIVKLAKAAGEGEYIFDLGKGVPPSNSMVNSYFKKKGATVTVHKLRHARATQIMTSLMQRKSTSPYVVYKNGALEARPRVDPSQKEAEESYKALALEVGKELGHSSGEKVTPMTAIGNYINPIITTGYFDALSLRRPSWAKKFEK